MPSAHYRSEFSLAVLDLGLEHAIEINGGRQKLPDRRRVSARWLCGTILTGLAGAALLGAAVYAALDHQSNFAQAADTGATAAQRGRYRHQST